jgi:flavodoxin
MKTLICVYSYHHKNTEKIASAIAGILDATVKSPQDLTPADITGYDLVGFGAGIDSGKHYKPLLQFADSLPAANGQKVFIFSTAGITSEKKVAKDHRALRDILSGKGYTVVGEFGCKGYNTNSVLKLFGGMNKNSPNADDIKAAEAFANTLKAE